MVVSVVIPTYNRGAKLFTTIAALLRCDATGFSQVEIFVVDDGSKSPVPSVIPGAAVRPPFLLQVIRQENAGAGPARNRGFREASGEIVAFIDDDILVPPNFLTAHAAAHQRFPGSVIVGACAIQAPAKPNALYRHVVRIQPDEPVPDENGMLPSLASGNISFEAKMFSRATGIYTDLPGADDAELSYRMNRDKVPMRFVKGINGEQDQPLTIAYQMARTRHHAFGLGFLANSYEDWLPHEAKRFRQTNGPIASGDSFKRRFRKFILAATARPFIDALLLWGIALLEALRMPDRVLFLFYRFALESAFLSGFRRGLAMPTNDDALQYQRSLTQYR